MGILLLPLVLMIFGHLCTAFSYTNRRSYAHSSSTQLAMCSSSSNAPNNAYLQGKTALITGSSGGIGKAIAKTFAAAGCDVIIHFNKRRDGAISTYKEINDKKTISGKCLGIIQCDFNHPTKIQEMFQTITQDILQDSRLDILVNNAGIVTKLAVEDDDEHLSTWHETMAVNLHAPLQLMKLFHAHMKSPSSTTNGSKKSGVIINNSSIHGERSVEWMSQYAASKAALDSLTRSLACEYASDGIRVNSIAPGVVPVERTAQYFSQQQNVDLWTPHLPLGRLGNVQDISEACLLLATNEWMSGTILTVDGAMMARANMPMRPKPPKTAAKIYGNRNENGDVNDASSSSVLFEVP